MDERLRAMVPSSPLPRRSAPPSSPSSAPSMYSGLSVDVLLRPERPAAEAATSSASPPPPASSASFMLLSSATLARYAAESLSFMMSQR